MIVKKALYSFLIHVFDGNNLIFIKGLDGAGGFLLAFSIK